MSSEVRIISYEQSIFGFLFYPSNLMSFIFLVSLSLLSIGYKLLSFIINSQKVEKERDERSLLE